MVEYYFIKYTLFNKSHFFVTYFLIYHQLIVICPGDWFGLLMITNSSLHYNYYKFTNILIGLTNMILGMALTQNSNLVPSTTEPQIDDEDDFGDFVGVQLEVRKSPSTAAAPHIYLPPLHVPLPNLVPPAHSFTPVTGKK